MTTPNPPLDVDALDELEAKALEAPWGYCGEKPREPLGLLHDKGSPGNNPCKCGFIWASNGEWIVAKVTLKDEEMGEITRESQGDTMRLLVALRNAWPSVSAKLKAQEEVIEALEDDTEFDKVTAQRDEARAKLKEQAEEIGRLEKEISRRKNLREFHRLRAAGLEKDLADCNEAFEKDERVTALKAKLKEQAAQLEELESIARSAGVVADERAAEIERLKAARANEREANEALEDER